MVDNPYAPPQARVADAAGADADGDFLPDGQALPAGRGWSWIADSWAFTGVQRGTFILLWVVATVLWVAVSFIPGVGILAALFSFVIAGGIVLGCDALRRGEPLEIGHLFAAFRVPQMGRLVGVGGILLGISLAFGLIIGLGMVAVIFGMSGGQADPEAFAAMGLWVILAVLVMIALTLPLYMAVWFAAPLIVLHDFAVGAALRASFRACLKNVVPFLVWGLAMLVLVVVASLPLFLGWLLLGPVLLVSSYVSYRDIFFAR